MKKYISKDIAYNLITLSIFSVVTPTLSIATPIAVQGTATNENAISIGSDSYATSVNGIAKGKGSIATGQGFNREDFANKVNEQNALLNNKATKQDELDKLKTNLDVNEQAQNVIGKQIQDLNAIIDRKEEKSRQLDDLNNRLQAKDVELDGLRDTLAQAKAQATNGSGTPDRTIWTDFATQLGKLNWANLSNNDNGTSGINKVATELKSMVESDYPDIANWEIVKYEEIISGYINRQGLFDANQDNIGNTIAQNNNYFGMNHVTWEVLSNLLNYDSTSNKGRVYNGNGNQYSATTLVNYLDNQDIKNVPIEKIDINSILNMTYESVGDYSNSNNRNRTSDNGENTLGYALYNMKSIINSETLNPLQNIARAYVADPYNHGNNSIITTLFELPPILEGNQARLLFTTDTDLHKFLSRTFQNDLETTDNSTLKRFISDTDIKYIKDWVSSFYDNFYSKIDFNADDSKWLFDKENYTAQLSTVEGFASKLRDYVSAYDEAVADPQNAGAQVRLITLYNQIREQKDDPKNYFENINIELKQSTLDLWNQFAEKSSKELTDYALRLKLYDARNEVIQGVTEAAKNIKADIDNAQRAVDAKQREIDDINKQIADLALTPDEQGAADLKAEKERELADKQAEKTQLEEDKVRKQNELDEINQQLANSSLKDLGLRSQAHGSNAFASGNDSIAMGTNATVTANDGIVIGRDSVVTGVSSMAIGASNTVQSANAVAFGNNITIGMGFDGAVVLGDSSTVAAANPTASMEIRGETYNFAGTAPTSTVSVGAEGKERQLVNLAAGRISNTSTDAINGSQLYALADAVNKLETGAIDPDDVSDAIQNALTNNLKAGNNVTIDEEVNPDTNQKTFTIHATQPTISAGDNITVNKDGNNITINAVPFDVQAGTGVTVNKDGNTFTVNAKQPDIQAGTGVTIDKQGDTLTINAQGKDYRAGDNVVIKDVEGQTFISANSTTVSSGAGITVTTTTTTTANGATNTNYEVALAESLKAQIAKEESVTGEGNIIVTQDGANETGGKNFVVKLANDVDLGDKGSLKLGDIEIAGGNINMGGNQIQGVAKGKKPTDAVNVEQLNEAKSTVTASDKVNVLVGKNADGSTNYTVNAKTSEVKGGTNAQVVETTGDNGQSVYTVNVKGDLTNINSIQGDSGTKITLGDTIDVGGARISNVGTPLKPTDAVNKAYVDNGKPTVSSTDSTVKIIQTVVNATTGAINYDLSVTGLDKGLNSKTDDGKVTNYKLGDTITVTGDNKNISTATNGGKVQVKLADDVKVNSVTTGDVSISKKGVNAGGKKVTNVAPATISPTSTEAVNGSQLYATNLKVNQNTQHIAKLGDRVNHLDNKLNQVNKDLRAGVAGAAAIAGLPQVRGHGKSMFAASAGNYKGQSAIAVGYTRASDNGKLLLKLSGSANTQGDIVSSVGLGYEW